MPTVPQAASASDELDLHSLNHALQDASAAELIRWAARRFGQHFAISSSFGAQSAVMLHLVSTLAPDAPVIFVDTGYLFPETYQFAEELTQRLGLNLQVYQSPISPARMEALYGKLWEQGTEGLNRYNQIRKVEPMQRALRELDIHAWAAGLRRQQTDYRANLPRVDEQTGRFKLHPILYWTTKDVHDYLTQYELPYHPLYDQGYASIGDTHSTIPITARDHERAGRFHGLQQECGLHLPTSEEESQSLDSSGL